MKDFIHFFGTTGNKELIFANKLEAGGMYLCVDNTKIIVDPGPGTLKGFVKEYPNEIQNIDAIIVSHVHFDHSNDMGVFIEGMASRKNQTNKNSIEEKKGVLFATKQTIETELKEYLKDVPEKILTITEKQEYILKNLKIKISVPHIHGDENYGFSISANKKTISFITDTLYFDGLEVSYLGSDVLVINATYVDAAKSKQLSLNDLPKIVNRIKPELVILTHFGKCMYEANPQKVAKDLSKKLGIKIIAAQDNKKYYF